MLGKIEGGRSQLVKNLPAVQEAWVRSLGREDPLEKGLATHSSVLAWKIPWIEEPGYSPQNRGWEKVRACGQGSQLWRPRSDEPGVCGEPRPVKAVTPGTIQASLKDWLSARLPQRLGQQSDTETRRCTEIKGKSRSLLQTKL